MTDPAQPRDPARPVPPGRIADMVALRHEIDAVDRALVALLVKRAALIDRAAQLKPAEGMPARIDARVETVVGNVRRAAQAGGLDADLAEDLWRRLIDWSIAREEAVLGPSADGGPAGRALGAGTS